MVVWTVAMSVDAKVDLLIYNIRIGKTNGQTLQ